jgi:HAD superfamily hydrolase (TIGR01450 family)
LAGSSLLVGLAAVSDRGFCPETLTQRAGAVAVDRGARSVTVGAVAVVEALFGRGVLALSPPLPDPSSSEPQAARSSTAATSGVARKAGRRTAAKHNQAVTLAPLVRRYDHLILDLDGCLWVGEDPTPDAPAAIEALREEGKGLAFLTNGVRESGEEIVRKLWRLGFRASLAEVVTVGGALQHRLALRGGGSAFVVGPSPIYRHVEAAGMRVVNGTDLAPRADVVVLAGHEGFDYGELRTAIQAALRGADVLSAGRDRTYPMPDGPWPGTGTLVAAVEYGSGVRVESVGKPGAQIFATALDRLGPGRALVVGDRLDSDLAGARAAGLDGAIVLTGATDREQAEAASDPRPVALAETLAELVLDGAR